jgi:amino acid transporter
MPGGPFAAFATILGMQWLAAALYFDAVLSPSGTALAYVGATARINYALAENQQFPKLFLQLNAAKVPVWALLFNFGVGFLLFLPFPGWAELVGFISSAAVLSLAFGPVSLAALRRQQPELARPFRLWAGRLVSAISFVLVGCVVYWTGWDTNWKVFALALVGAASLSLLHLYRGDFSKLHARQSAWFWLFVGGLALVSYVGNYGHGLGLLHHGLDMIVVAVFSLAVFSIALITRLDDAEAAALLAAPASGDAHQ